MRIRVQRDSKSMSVCSRNLYSPFASTATGKFTLIYKQGVVQFHVMCPTACERPKSACLLRGFGLSRMHCAPPTTPVNSALVEGTTLRLMLKCSTCLWGSVMTIYIIHPWNPTPHQLLKMVVSCGLRLHHLHEK